MGELAEEKREIEEEVQRIKDKGNCPSLSGGLVGVNMWFYLTVVINLLFAWVGVIAKDMFTASLCVVASAFAVYCISRIYRRKKDAPTTCQVYVAFNFVIFVVGLFSSLPMMGAQTNYLMPAITLGVYVMVWIALSNSERNKRTFVND